MSPIIDIDALLKTPEKRMKLVRLFYIIALVMLVLGYILIIIALFFDGIFP